MIKIKNLPSDILKRLPHTYKRLRECEYVVALYIFGSLNEKQLKPLSDLDFAVLLSDKVKDVFDIQLELIGILIDTLHTEEFDLIILNTAPVRFSFNIVKDGKLIFCKDKKQFINFRERIIKEFVDFKYYLNEFNQVFLEGTGYHG